MHMVMCMHTWTHRNTPEYMCTQDTMLIHTYMGTQAHT